MSTRDRVMSGGRSRGAGTPSASLTAGARPAADAGSVTPLVIGMVLGLLLLAAGVTAAGSAVLARRSLQSACDGAAAAVAGDLLREQAGPGSETLVTDRLNAYLADHYPQANAAGGIGTAGISARCAVEAPITFGALFATPRLHIEVDAVGRMDRG